MTLWQIPGRRSGITRLHSGFALLITGLHLPASQFLALENEDAAAYISEEFVDKTTVCIYSN